MLANVSAACLRCATRPVQSWPPFVPTGGRFDQGVGRAGMARIMELRMFHVKPKRPSMHDKTVEGLAPTVLLCRIGFVED